MADDKKQSRIRTFFNNLTSLFGFRRTPKKPVDTNKPGIHPKGTKSDIEFVKVDIGGDSKNRVAQAKIGRILNTPLSDKLDKLVNEWLNETYDTYQELSERFKRLAELEFAIMNDPFLGMVVDLSADEATQIDVADQLVGVECSNPEMKKKMYQLMEQWGITQNRVRAVMYQLAGYADAFWSCKVTPKGIERINPIKIRQVLDRMEFNPIEVAVKMQAKKANNVLTYVVNRDKRIKTMLQILDDETPDTLADLFDYKLFGFVLTDEIVVPPWSVIHFRLAPEQSEFYPWGKPFLLKALAPFKQANATMILQGLARIASFPITVYSVRVAPGMDEMQQFELINEIREEYDKLGVENTSGEVYSVNTKLWIPEGLITVSVHSPSIDTNSIGDLELLQDRVVVASGVPKGFLVQEWGGFGNSGISLIQQHKPFARRAFTYQSAFLEGLNQLFRIHFAITGEFDYREPFVLSMNFPNEEMNADRIMTQRSTLELAKMVIDMLRELIATVDDPLPIEIIRDIMAKFSFLAPTDLRSWIKASYIKSMTPGMGGMGDEFGMGGMGLGGGLPMGGGMGGGLGEFPPASPVAGSPGMEPGPMGIGGGGINDLTAFEKNYIAFTKKRFQEVDAKKKNGVGREKELVLRYEEIKEKLFVETLKQYRITEGVSNARHIKLCEVEQVSDLMFKALNRNVQNAQRLKEQKEIEPERELVDILASFETKLDGIPESILKKLEENDGRVKEYFGEKSKKKDTN